MLQIADCIARRRASVLPFGGVRGSGAPILTHVYRLPPILSSLARSFAHQISMKSFNIALSFALGLSSDIHYPPSQIYLSHRHNASTLLQFMHGGCHPPKGYFPPINNIIITINDNNEGRLRHNQKIFMQGIF